MEEREGGKGEKTGEKERKAYTCDEVARGKEGRTE